MESSWPEAGLTRSAVHRRMDYLGIKQATLAQWHCPANGHYRTGLSYLGSSQIITHHSVIRYLNQHLKVVKSSQKSVWINMGTPKNIIWDHFHVCSSLKWFGIGPGKVRRAYKLGITWLINTV